MFGGSPARTWPLAAVALNFADEFVTQYRAAKPVMDELIVLLSGDGRFDFEPIPDGTNGLWLHLADVDSAAFVSALADRNIRLIPPRPQWDGLLLFINPTLARTTATSLAAAFRSAADEASG